MASKTLLTIDDYERLPQEIAEGHELVDGELVDVSGNVPKHVKICDWLGALLLFYVVDHGLGDVLTEQEYDFDGNAHAPDVSFYAVEKVPLCDDNLRVQRFVPDLAIEVVSRNDTFQSLICRKERYRKCGTREVWIISPESLEVYVFAEKGDRILRLDSELSTPLIPGWQIPVKKLFERITPRA